MSPLFQFQTMSLNHPTGFRVSPSRAPRMRWETAPAVTRSQPAEPATTSALDAPASQEMLRRVNRLVNGRVRQRTDQAQFGRAEVWQRSGIDRGAQGDCKDIAIEKRFQLIAAGFPANRLYFAEVYLPQAGLHAVLMARTDDGDFVLDSRTPYINRWDRTDYSWISIQSPTNPMTWHALAHTAVEIVTLEPTGHIG